jgi:osmotically-inducible protein OsmY
MKRAFIRSALRRAGWTLAAAGTVGLSSVAMAQIASPFQRGTREPSAAVRTAATTAWLTENYARLVEMRVELAWLADPTTFPYRLGAHVSNLAVEVRGYVPNDSVRQHALRLAREETGLEIVDALRIQPRLPLHSTTRPLEALQRDAQQALKETFPHFGRGLGVLAQANGTVTVTGIVSCYEEKLGVSQRLARVSGCTSVVNNIGVQPVQNGERLYTRVTANGKLLVPYEEAPAETPPQAASASGVPQDERTSQIIQPVAHAVPPEPPLELPAPAVVAPVERAPVGAVAQPGVVLVPSPGPREATVVLVPGTLPPPQPSMTFPTTAKAPAPMPTPPKEATPPPPMHFYQTQWRRPEVPSISAPNVMPMPSAQAEVPVATSASGEPAVRAAGTPSVSNGVVLAEAAEPAPKVVVQPTVATPPPTRSSSPQQPIVTTGVILIETLEPTPPVQARADVSLPGQTPVQAPAPGLLPAPASPTVQAPVEVPPPSQARAPLAPPVQAPVPTPSPIRMSASVPPPVQARVETSLPIQAPAPVPPPVQVPVQTPSPIRMPVRDPIEVRLKQRIEAACGTAVRDVEVVLQSATQVLVRLKARSDSEGERLSAKVFLLPELGPYQVSLDVQVVP